MQIAGTIIIDHIFPLPMGDAIYGILQLRLTVIEDIGPRQGRAKG